jgi:hypothetical protein
MEIKYEPDVSYKPVYVSIDGTHHYHKYDAIRHDAVSLAGSRYVEQESLELPDDETYMVVSHITCKEDWDYLYYTQWEQHIFGDDYTGPSWYGSIRHTGRDVDEYEIIKIDENYSNKYKTFIDNLHHLTSE